MRATGTPSHVAGRYEITGRIGAGGMGDVLRAHDPVLGRTVALKILPFDLAVQPGFVDRFRAEAQAAARISHANVVQVHDWGQQDETYYMVMEYVRGKNLRQVLSGLPEGRLDPKQAAQVIGQVLGALSAAHAKDVVHRDVKPENVMVAVDGRVKVADFGIARALERAVLTGGLMGTVAYVAPEQARGEPVDVRADLYSTGCMFYELLTGSLPFEGDAAKVLQEHLNSRVPPPSEREPSIPPELDRVVLKATAPDREERYRSAAEMRKDLASVIAQLPDAPPLTELIQEFTSEVPVEGLSTVVRRKPRRKKRRLVQWLLLLVFLAGAAGGVWYIGPTRVPDVTGMESGRAAALIAEAGLAPGQTDAFSDAAPGTVVGVAPFPGVWTRKGEDVTLSVSVGPKLSQVPSVVGMQLEAAKQSVIDAGLQLGGVTRRNDREPPGKVIGQDPEPSTVRAGDLVALVVSDGPLILDVPALAGQGSAAAEKALTDLGFVVAVEQVFNGASSGTVLGQAPPAGEKHPQGTEVKLQVSKGPAPFQMPDVKGKPCSEVKGQLEALGMKVVSQSSAGGAAECGSSRVLEQDPLPGGTRRAGEEATLYLG
ncbi:MAG: Stk1 family PASTA domain-containing Ser/Thr kinase [Actinomycetota bacterium]